MADGYRWCPKGKHVVPAFGEDGKRNFLDCHPWCRECRATAQRSWRRNREQASEDIRRVARQVLRLAEAVREYRLHFTPRTQRQVALDLELVAALAAFEEPLVESDAETVAEFVYDVAEGIT